MEIWDSIELGNESVDALISGLHRFFDEHTPDQINFNPMIDIYQSCEDPVVRKKLLKVVLGYPQFAHKCHHEGEPPHDFSSWLLSRIGTVGIPYLQELDWNFSWVDANGCGLLHKIHQFSLSDETLTVFINRYPDLLEQRNVMSHTPIETHLQLGNLEELNRLLVLGATLPKFDDVRMGLLPEISKNWLSEAQQNGSSMIYQVMQCIPDNVKRVLN
ncbi:MULTISPECIES: hypothetical protein [Aeromonas]|uniref:Uncharacterized protein n=1 Tax=Aeromonas veronii TaxID=654 RepID=A0A4S5CCT0_AERVE|nr:MULTISPECIES: hypothetical protein [Aeromonas]THJ43597.1 hypothetical protein E8Q35_14925 [Aeromonas veronii]